MVNEATSYKRPRLMTHPRLLVRRIVRAWPVAVWAVLALLASLLYVQSNGFVGMAGVVQTTAEPVAPLETARLIAVLVTTGESVTNGQIVAVMDTTMLEAELALERAQLAEAQETMARYRQNLVRMLRDAQAEARDAETALALQELNARRDTSRLRALMEEAARRRELRAQNLMDAMDASALDPEIAALQEAVKAYPALIEAYRRRQAESEQDSVSIREWLGLGAAATPNDANAVLTSRAEVERDVLRQSSEVLARRRERYTLRTTRAGIVSRVFFVAGDVVQAGSPVVRVVASNPRHVVGLLPEAHVSNMGRGQPVLVFRRGRAGRAVEAVVSSVGPEVRDLPSRVSPIRGQPLRGRRVTIELRGESDFLSGETVDIRPRGASWRQIWGGLKRALE